MGVGLSVVFTHLQRGVAFYCSSSQFASNWFLIATFVCWASHRLFTHTHGGVLFAQSGRFNQRTHSAQLFAPSFCKSCKVTRIQSKHSIREFNCIHFQSISLCQDLWRLSGGSGNSQIPRLQILWDFRGVAGNVINNNYWMNVISERFVINDSGVNILLGVCYTRI